VSKQRNVICRIVSPCYNS